MCVELASSEEVWHLEEREKVRGIQMLALPLASSAVMGKLFNFAYLSFPIFILINLLEQLIYLSL